LIVNFLDSKLYDKPCIPLFALILQISFSLMDAELFLLIFFWNALRALIFTEASAKLLSRSLGLVILKYYKF